MKTASKGQDYDPMGRQSGRKSRKAKSLSRKRTFYSDLNALFKRYPISTVNQFGERVISGIIIC